MTLLVLMWDAPDLPSVEKLVNEAKDIAEASPNSQQAVRKMCIVPSRKVISFGGLVCIICGQASEGSLIEDLGTACGGPSGLG